MNAEAEHKNGIAPGILSKALKLLTFDRGIHPYDSKFFTSLKNIEVMPLPDEVFIPVVQHIGAPCKPVVSAGEKVKTGQLVAKSDAFISSPVHSSITGTVKTIDYFPHPSGRKQLAVHIKRDSDEDEWEYLDVQGDPDEKSREEILEIIKSAGIVGLGGAGFPTHAKLTPREGSVIDTFILNGCECEPYLTSDHRMMSEMTEKIFRGLRLVQNLLEVKKTYIGIESNKPDAVFNIRHGIKRFAIDAELSLLKAMYPQGAEKVLIHTVLNRTIPEGGLPADIGTIVSNIGTVVAVADAVYWKKPLIEKVVSVTGNSIERPGNVVVRIGTPMSKLIDFCGGIKKETSKIIMGGPMMGTTQHDMKAPVIKTTGGIIFDQAKAKKETVKPCIKCSACVESCPMSLLPTRISRLSEIGRYEDADSIGIMSCIECGCCSYVCPSKIPLVQLIRSGKFMLRKQKAKAG